MKKAIVILLICFIVLSLVGCGGGGKLSGTWENGSGSTLEFGKDELIWTMDTFGTKISTTYEYEAKDGKITFYEDSVRITGSYSIDGKELTISGTLIFDGIWTKK